ncbi:MAG: enoyl-CoA hydratase-related protein [Mycobacteriaceae bacterium]
MLTDRVLHVAVSTGDKGASMDDAALAALVRVLRGDTTEIGCVLLQGAGANFCTGGNVAAFAAADDPEAAVGEMATRFHVAVTALTSAPVPVVAAVTGWAAGAGMSTALTADVIVRGPGTRFRPAYPSIGFSPDGGMSWSLPRAIGAARARDVLLTDAVIDGEKAYAWGLMTRLVDDDAVRSTALEVATALAHGPARSHAAIRTLVREGRQRTLTEHLPHEAEAIAACAASRDGREGVQAFLQRRPPIFGS